MMMMDWRDWSMNVTGRYKSPTSRQCLEGIQIQEEKNKERVIKGEGEGLWKVLNSRADWNQPGVIENRPRRLTDELKE